MKTESFALEGLFNFPSIKGVTEDYVRLNPGSIPVYGGRMTGTPVGYIADNLSGVKYFENCLGWNRQGSVGYVFYHPEKFTTTDDHRPLDLKKSYQGLVDLQYVAVILEELLQSMGFSWGKTAGKNKVSTFSIEIPVDSEGNIDTLTQVELRNRKLKTIKLQDRLKAYLDLLTNHLIDIGTRHETRNVSLDDDAFSLKIGTRVLKKDIVGVGVPVFSANVNVPFGFIKVSNLDDFSKPSLLWGIDGNFDWAIVEQGVIFATTDHCGRLQVNSDLILPEYMFHVLKNSASSYGFDRTFRASLKNISEVNVPIPVTPDGEFDVGEQVRIVEKYRKLLQIKSHVVSKLQNIINVTVE